MRAARGARAAAAAGGEGGEGGGGGGGGGEGGGQGGDAAAHQCGWTWLCYDTYEQAARLAGSLDARGGGREAGLKARLLEVLPLLEQTMEEGTIEDAEAEWLLQGHAWLGARALRRFKARHSKYSHSKRSHSKCSHSEYSAPSAASRRAIVSIAIASVAIASVAIVSVARPPPLQGARPARCVT